MEAFLSGLAYVTLTLILYKVLSYLSGYREVHKNSLPDGHPNK